MVAGVTSSQIFKHAPRIWLNEPVGARHTFPCSIDFFLAGADRAVPTDAATSDVHYDLASPTSWRAAFHGQPFTAATAKDKAPPVYALVCPQVRIDLATGAFVEQAGCTVVAYYALFAFNNGKRIRALGGTEVGRHVGDWERVYVGFEAGEAATMATKAHNLPIVARPYNCDQFFFMARGSHGSWFDAGEHRYVAGNRFVPRCVSADIVDECARGVLWDTKVNLVVVEREVWSGRRAFGGRIRNSGSFEFKLGLSKSNSTLVRNVFTDIARWGNRASGCQLLRAVSGGRVAVLGDGPRGPTVDAACRVSIRALPRADVVPVDSDADADADADADNDDDTDTCGSMHF